MNQIWQQRERILALIAWDRLAGDEMKHACDTGYLRAARTRQVLTDDLRDLVALQVGAIANVRKSLMTLPSTERASLQLGIAIDNIETEMRMLRVI